MRHELCEPNAAGIPIAICFRHSCYWLAVCHQSTCKHMPACALVLQGLSQVCHLCPAMRPLCNVCQTMPFTCSSPVEQPHGHQCQHPEMSSADVLCRSVWPVAPHVNARSIRARHHRQSPLLYQCSRCSTAKQKGVQQYCKTHCKLPGCSLFWQPRALQACFGPTGAAQKTGHAKHRALQSTLRRS